MNPHILVVEDESKLAQLISKYLEREGFRHSLLSDGADVMSWLKDNKTDLILLDLNLPNRDGLTLCREIRNTSSVPVIMTTARVDEIDRLLGLELGADDYVCKPYSPRELMARIKAVLRRTNGQTSVLPAVSPKPWRLDEARLVLEWQGVEILLTLVEFQLLKMLSTTPGRIFSRELLMDGIYQDRRVVSDRTIDSHIKKLRRKLTQASPAFDPIVSVYGAGYKFEHPG
jgi:two-component system response regulator BaeR